MKNYFFLASLIVLHMIQQKNGSRKYLSNFFWLLIHGWPFSQLNYKGNNGKLEIQKCFSQNPCMHTGFWFSDLFTRRRVPGRCPVRFSGAADRLVAVSSPQLDSKGSNGRCPQGIAHLKLYTYSKFFQRFESVPIGFLAHFYPGQGGRLVFVGFF